MPVGGSIDTEVVQGVSIEVSFGDRSVLNPSVLSGIAAVKARATCP